MEPQRLREAWTTIRRSRPSAPQRDAADVLGVSEAQLVAARCGDGVTRMSPMWTSLLYRMGQVGPVIGMTRSAHAVLEHPGVYRRLEAHPDGLRVWDDGIELHAHFDRWHHSYAISEVGRRGVHQSLQFFDEVGRSVHKIVLTRGSDHAAFDRMVEEFAHDDQDPNRPLGVRRASTSGTRSYTQQLPALAITLAPHALEQALALAAERTIPIEVTVASAGTTQSCTKVICNVVADGGWLSVLDEGLNLHLREAAVQAVCLVPAATDDPSSDTLEARDATGNVLAQLRGTLMHGEQPAHAWRQLVSELPRH